MGCRVSGGLGFKVRFLGVLSLALGALGLWACVGVGFGVFGFRAWVWGPGFGVCGFSSSGLDLGGVGFRAPELVFVVLAVKCRVSGGLGSEFWGMRVVGVRFSWRGFRAQGLRGQARQGTGQAGQGRAPNPTPQTINSNP